MAKLAGTALRLFQTFLYALELCCAAVILGIYSYFLAVLANRNLPISNWKRAVEGLAGSAVLYLLFAVLLTCFLGGKAFFAFLAIVLDLLFCGAFVAIAVMTRHGTQSCSSGYVDTPLGSGPVNSADTGYGSNGFGFGSAAGNTYAPSLGRACRLNKACFAVAVIGAVLFLLSALVQLFIARQHKKEKALAANDHDMDGGKRRFWQRKRAPRTTKEAYGNDAELGTVGAAGVVGTTGGLAAHRDTTIRPSHDTAYTGSTVAAPNGTAYAGNKMFEPQGTAVIPTMEGSHPFHVGPTGTAVSNPYGYDNTRGTARDF